MHRTVPRHALIALLAVAAAAGCTSQAEKERLARPPLREVFAPPTLEAPPAAAAPGAAPAGAAGAAPATGAAAVDANAAAFESVPAAAAGGGAALKAPAPSVQAPEEMRAPAAASADSEGAHLKAPSLSEPPAAAAPAAAAASAAAAPAPDAPGPAQEPAAPAPDAAPPARAASAGEIDLAKEFESIPAAGASAAAAQTAAAEPAPVPAAEEAPHAAAPTPVPVPSSSATAPAAAVPKVIVTNRPAVLVSIQGPPTYGPMPGSKLQRVLNTPAFLVKGASGNLYLSVYDGFMTAPKLAGPWSVMKTVPRVVQDAKARVLQEGEADLLAGNADATGKRPSLKQPPAPRVVVATQPTALVVTRGDPVYEPVEGTKLSRVANTDSLLYVNRPEDRTYLKVGDHWYRAKSLKGPWSAVAADALPEGLEDAIPAK